MLAHHALPKHKRLYQILERLNLIHCRRRLNGRRTSHLSARCRVLSQAWLDCRPI